QRQGAADGRSPGENGEPGDGSRTGTGERRTGCGDIVCREDGIVIVGPDGGWRSGLTGAPKTTRGVPLGKIAGRAGVAAPIERSGECGAGNRGCGEIDMARKVRGAARTSSW